MANLNLRQRVDDAWQQVKDIMPAVWAKFLADILLDVQARLEDKGYSIQIDVKPQSGKCIFIIIVASDKYSSQSRDNMNTSGWDWYGLENRSDFDINIEVGVKNYWYTSALFAALLNHRRRCVRWLLRPSLHHHPRGCENPRGRCVL